MKHIYDENNCLVNLSNSILKHYGIPTFHNSLLDIDNILKSKKVCLLLLDGFGKKIQEIYKDYCPFISSGNYKTISSTFPPTTVAATTSLMSAKFPCETGWLGWTTKFENVIYPVLTFSSLLDFNLGPSNIDTNKELKYTSIIEMINKTGKKAGSIHSFEIENNDSDVFFSKSDELIKNNDFTYVYSTEPDHQLHLKGVYSDENKELIRKLDDSVKKLVENNKDTTFIVIADHGHLDVKNCYVKEHQDFLNLLKYPYYFIEGRAASFYIKEGMNIEFEKISQKLYNDDFYILNRDEVISNEVFGIGKECEKFKSLLGDYLFISKGKACFNNKEEIINISNHAGSSEDEMLVNLSLFNV